MSYNVDTAINLPDIPLGEEILRDPLALASYLEELRSRLVELFDTQVIPLLECLEAGAERSLTLQGSVTVGSDVSIEGDLSVGGDGSVTGELVTGYGFYRARSASGFDFTEADLTLDGTWRDLDVSGLIDEGAKLVHFDVRVRDDLVGALFGLRDKGGGAFNMSRAYTQVVNEWAAVDMFAAPNSSGIVEYWGSNTVWSDIDITVRGWWK